MMKLNDEIGIYSCARINSQRCKNKMLRSFGDTSLLDIFLSKLKALGPNTFFSGYEPIFREKCDEYGIEFIQRSEESSNAEEHKIIYSFLKEAKYKYLLSVNPCLPFLKVSTINNFLEKSRELREPAFSVHIKNNYYMDLNNSPYNFDKDIKTINTKLVEPVKEFAHILYFFRRDHFLENGFYWDWNDLNYIEIPYGIETLDIDTEEDFEMASFLWENNNVRSTYQDY